MKEKLKAVFGILKAIVRIMVKRETEHDKMVKRWLAVNGDETLRVEYEIDESGIVLDIGGYRGDFVAEIVARYMCNVYVFEPVNEFYSLIKKRFQKNKKVHVYPFGLSNRNFTSKITKDGNSSSIHKSVPEGVSTEEIALKNINDFIDEQGFERIDLIKINIEGEEYDLLDSLIAADKIKLFNNIQIQFHDIDEHSRKRMNAIQSVLAETHRLTYEYEFVWENWEAKNGI